jgi:mannose-6-phosphate isomerase-like protein (cupin superfamily)
VVVLGAQDLLVIDPPGAVLIADISHVEQVKQVVARLELIEVQSGSYLGEDDIVRFEDTYGRAKP